MDLPEAFDIGDRDFGRRYADNWANLLCKSSM